MDFSEFKNHETLQYINEVNQSLMVFEQQVHAINIGVEAWAPLDNFLQLGWKRRKPGPWRLFCKTTMNTEQPLLESPLEIRIEALEKMQSLVDALAANAQSRLDTIRHALSVHQGGERTQ